MLIATPIESGEPTINACMILEATSGWAEIELVLSYQQPEGLSI